MVSGGWLGVRAVVLLTTTDGGSAAHMTNCGLL